MREVIPLVLRDSRWRLGGIVVLAAIVRVLFFTGFHGFDDVFYIQRSYELSQGIFSLPTTHWAARIGLVGPTAVAYRAFGVSLGTTVLFPFLCSLLTVVATALLGRRLFGEPVGWLAAFLVAVFPLDVIFASMLFPTAPVTLLCGIGYGAFLLGDAEARQGWYLGSGAAFGLACVTHEAALVALSFYVVHVICQGRPRKGHLLALAGFFMALAVDPVIHGFMGNPHVRLDVLSHTATAQGTATDVAYSGFNVKWITEPVIRLAAERTFGLFSWLITLIALYRVLRPATLQDRALSLIVVTVFVWTEYGTMSLHRYAPLARLPRYLCPLTLPAMWLLAKYLCDAVRPKPRRILLAVLVASSLICLMVDSGNQLRPYDAIRSALTGIRPEAVAVEKNDEFPLRFAERMKPPYGLSVLGVTPPAQSIVIAKSPKLRRRLEAIPGISEVGSVTRPRTLYQAMLTSPFVLSILRIVRPPERFAEYKDKASPDMWTIYRIP